MPPRRRRETHTGSRELRPEFVALGLLAEGNAHGYVLFRRFRASLAPLWRISESQFYATLKRLEARGLVVSAEPTPGEGAAKRPLTLTPAGEALLDRWLAEPTGGGPRLVHLEFLARLHFAGRLRPDELPRLVEAQAASLAADLSRLGTLREAAGRGSGAPPAIHDLALAFRERQLRAAVDWIEEVVRPSLAAGLR